MAASALTVSDLSVMADEPRVRDLDLAERLEFGRTRNIRALIRRNADELALYGEVCATVERTSERGGRPGVEYWLNEPQALLVCMFARTARAAEVRRQVVAVFVAWRHGELEAASPPALDPWEHMERRLAALEAAAGFAGRVAPATLADTVTHLPIWNTGRRPLWWSDREVREFVVANHRQMTIDEAVRVMRATFGPHRSPSHSSLGRIWQRLDNVRGMNSARSGPIRNCPKVVH